MIYIFRFRPFEIKDVALARLIRPFATSRNNSKSKKQFSKFIKPFEQEGMVVELPKEKEKWFLEALVKTHPAHEKDFGHFLMDPPEGIMPSEIAKELENRSPMIPTLAIVKTNKGNIQGVKKMNYQKELFDLLSYSYNRGLIDPKACEPLLGIRPQRRSS